MSDSMAQPRWKNRVNLAAAIAVACIFLVPGIWMIYDADGAAMHMAQARVPQPLSLPAALLLAAAETTGGILVLIPRFRRWGALATGCLLAIFLVYFAWNYQTLRGDDCSCFPWIRRAVNPAFFVEDGLMLALAALAGIWAAPARGLRAPLLIFAAVAVSSLGIYRVELALRAGTRAPESIIVDGQPFSLQRGKILLFFFDPECSHCYQTAQRMAQFRWGNTKVIAVPVEFEEYADQFVRQAGLTAGVSKDLARLKQVFPFTGYPYGVALENGHEKAALTRFVGAEPAATLKRLGFIAD